METLEHLLQTLLHIDESLISFVSIYGGWTYFALFLIVFCETGLVVFPFLPGDSLLFAAGSLAANTAQPLSIQILFISLLIASILGNKLNYLLGRVIGPKVFHFSAADSGWARFLNKKHLHQAHDFYDKHGGKTIIFARFLPFLRTFVPFIAGISYMSVQRFTFYNVISALVWISSLLGAGYFFGNLPIVKNNFSIVIYSIIVVTILPALFAFIFKRPARTSG